MFLEEKLTVKITQNKMLKSLKYYIENNLNFKEK